MKKNSIGRNDRCPCGSGKKYKACCLRKNEQMAFGNAAKEVSDTLREAMADVEFSSIEEMQSYAQAIVDRKNTKASDDFHGLNPEQMHSLLYTPFASPKLVQFSAPKCDVVKSQFMVLFKFMVEAIGEDGVKFTAKGNLPAKLCKDAATFYLDNASDESLFRYRKINKEDDFYELHIVRLVAKEVGFIRKFKGRFLLTKKCQALVEKQDWATMYLDMLTWYVTTFNWGYGDRYPEFQIIQTAAIFSLYLLHCYGNEPRSHHFYADCFIQAFPSVLDEASSEIYSSPEDQVERCFKTRFLTRFAELFGLINVKTTKIEGSYDLRYEITKTPLLDSVVKFSI